MIARALAKHAALIVLCIIILFPVLWMFSTAFKVPTEIFSVGLIPRHPTLENIRTIIVDHPFWTWLGNSVIITVGVTLIRVLTSILAAYAFSFYRFAGQGFLFLLTVGSMMIPFPITMIPNYITISSLNLLNTHWGVIAPYTASGFGIFLLRQYMKSIPLSIIEAARIDGANSWRTLWSIVVPMVRGPIFALFIWLAIEGWNLFFWPMLVISEESMRTLPIAMLSFQDTEAGMLWGELMALATLTCLPTLIVYILARRQILQVSISSGVKG